MKKSRVLLPLISPAPHPYLTPAPTPRPRALCPDLHPSPPTRRHPRPLPASPAYLRVPPGPARPPSSEAALRGGGSSGRRGAALARVDTRRRSGRSSLRLRRSRCAPCARRARQSLPSRPCDTTSSKRARCFLGMKILPARTAESGRAPRPRPDRAKPRPKSSSRAPP